MQKVNVSPLSGFMELLPDEQKEFDRIKQVILEEHKKHGFLAIDTPLIWRREVLLAKAGGETEKQIYELERGDNKLALRFDHTVPLAAYVAGKQGELNFPFKVSQIGKNYRGERPQNGRYREFYQCDCDVVGRGSLDVAYDAEVISMAYDIYKQLDFGEFTIRVSNRKVLVGFLQGLALMNVAEIMRVIDRAEKISREDLEEELKQLSVTDEQMDKLEIFIGVSGNNEDVLNNLDEFGIENELFEEGVKELRQVVGQLAAMGIKDSVKVDLMIVRGLDYYTGTVFETILNEHPEVGSVASGGRYDNLVAQYSNESFPGVGISIGLTRLFSALIDAGLINITKNTAVDVLIIPIDRTKKGDEFCYRLAQMVRTAGKSADILFASGKVGKKMSYADKTKAGSVVVVGENEVESGKVLVKNMRTGEVDEFDEWLKNTQD